MKYLIQDKGIFVLIVLIFSLTGCAGVMNPYSSDFNCPKTYNGTCVSVSDAYHESLHAEVHQGDNGNDQALCDGCSSEKEREEQSTYPVDETTQEHQYYEALYEELTGLIKEPVTPLIAPPKAMRVLFLPYKGNSDELYMYRYIYFFVDRQTWILGDYLTDEGDE